MTELVLASGSPYRRKLLERLGVPFRSIEHRADEEAAKQLRLAPDDLAARLALEKADSLRGSCGDAFILGSDQVVDVDGRVLGKPGTTEAARAQLRLLSGRAHRLVTAVAIVGPNAAPTLHVDVHTMRMRALRDDEIERYVDADMPLDCCGSYRVERLGIALFEHVDGDDFTAIEGLPLIAVAGMLRDAGFAIP